VAVKKSAPSGFLAVVESTHAERVAPVTAGARIDEIEAVYRARLSVFVRVCSALMCDHELAVDAVQEGFAAAIRNRASYRGEGTVEGWVWGAVLNAARNDRRAQTRRRAHAATWTTGVTRPRSGSEPRGAVGDQVAALPERQRLVLFLRYYADLDYREIAAALGISVGTVGSTLNAAQATLRRALTGGGDDA
jgi:RNA polymerase sigma-70 factor (ECF subfamily)